MERKLIGLSTSTKVLSIPSKWLKENELEKGDTVNVEIADGRLIVSSKEQYKLLEKNIDISDAQEDLVWYTIDACYSAGYDIINITTKNLEQTRLLSRAVRYFPGMIIDEERTKSVRFKDISSMKEVNIDKLKRRIFHMIGTMIEDGLVALEEKDWDVLKDMKRRDYTLNSYFSLCLRYIAKKGYHKVRKAGVIHSYLKIVESFVDRYCMLTKEIGTNKSITPQQKKKFNEVMRLYEEMQELHYREKKKIHLAYNKLLVLEKNTKDNNAINKQFLELLGIIDEMIQLELMYEV